MARPLRVAFEDTIYHLSVRGLDTGRKRYILRRKEGNPFHDEELEKQIRAGGSVIGGGTILMSERSEATGSAPSV